MFICDANGNRSILYYRRCVANVQSTKLRIFKRQLSATGQALNNKQKFNKKKYYKKLSDLSLSLSASLSASSGRGPAKQIAHRNRMNDMTTFSLVQFIFRFFSYQERELIAV